MPRSFALSRMAAAARATLARSLLGPSLFGFEYCDVSLLEVLKVERASVETTRTLRKHARPGREERPAAGLVAGYVVDCDGELIHAFECKA
jgi:hypothetical protein